LTSTAAALLQDRLGLSDDELLTTLGADPLSVLGGDLDHQPALPILLALTEGHDPAALRTWVRATGRSGRPLDLLLARDYAGFEDALGDFEARGLTIRRRGPSPPATPR
jgi:hypothetical protein